MRALEQRCFVKYPLYTIYFAMLSYDVKRGKSTVVADDEGTVSDLVLNVSIIK